MKDFILFSCLINTICFFVVFIFVLIKDNKRNINIYLFLAFTLFGLIWQISLELLLFYISNLNYANYCQKVIEYSSIFTSLSLYLFLFSYRNMKNLYIYILGIIFASGIIVVSFFVPISYTPRPFLYFNFWATRGPLFFPYFMLISTLYSAPLVYLGIAYYKNREQKDLILVIALTICIVGGFTNWFLWIGIMIPPFGMISLTIYSLLIAYIVLKYKFMDINVVIKRSTYFIMLFLLIIYPVTIVTNYFLSVINFGRINLILIAFVWTLVILLIDKTKSFLTHFTDKIFFMADYNYDEVLADMTNKLQRVTDIRALVNNFDKELKKIMKVENFGIFISNHNKTRFHILTVDNIDSVLDKQPSKEKMRSIIPIRYDNPVIDELKRRTKNCIEYNEVKDDFKRDGDLNLEHIMSIMDMIEAKLLIGSVDNDDVTGMIAVGQKKSGQDFSTKDINLLYTLVNQGALVVSKIFEIEEKAKLHAEKEIEAKFREEVEEVNTQLRETIIELERTQEKLIEEEQLSAMGKLAGEVAHDIRNPLSSINRFISSLFDKGCLKNSKLVLADIYKRVEISEAVADKPVVLEYMKFVIANIQEVEDSLFEIKDINTSLRKIAGDFLEYSKVSRDIPTVNLKVVDVISELLAGCEQDCQEKGITIVKNFNSLRCVCLFDYQLQKVFTNIFDNAQKAILEAETVRKEIKVSLYDNGKEMITLEIADSGTGIPEDDLKLIFKPFYTKRKNLQGTGLGLAIIKKIVENNQGIIDVSSVVGVGTTFKISFYCSD